MRHAGAMPVLGQKPVKRNKVGPLVGRFNLLFGAARKQGETKWLQCSVLMTCLTVVVYMHGATVSKTLHHGRLANHVISRHRRQCLDSFVRMALAIKTKTARREIILGGVRSTAGLHG